MRSACLVLLLLACRAGSATDPGSSPTSVESPPVAPDTGPTGSQGDTASPRPTGDSASPRPTGDSAPDTPTPQPPTGSPSTGGTGAPSTGGTGAPPTGSPAPAGTGAHTGPSGTGADTAPGRHTGGGTGTLDSAGTVDTIAPDTRDTATAHTGDSGDTAPLGCTDTGVRLSGGGGLPGVQLGPTQEALTHGTASPTRLAWDATDGEYAVYYPPPGAGAPDELVVYAAGLEVRRFEPGVMDAGEVVPALGFDAAGQVMLVAHDAVTRFDDGGAVVSIAALTFTTDLVPPEIARNAAGEWAVIGELAGSGHGVQRLDPDGVPLWAAPVSIPFGEVYASGGSVVSQSPGRSAPSIGIDAVGQLVVAWSERLTITSAYSSISSTFYKYQRLDPSGAALGATVSKPGPISVAVREDGTYVVAWYDAPGEGWVEVFDGCGTSVHGPVLVTADADERGMSLFSDERPSLPVQVAGAYDGSFVVTWSEDDAPHVLYFDADAIAVGPATALTATPGPACGTSVPDVAFRPGSLEHALTFMQSPVQGACAVGPVRLDGFHLWAAP